MADIPHSLDHDRATPSRRAGGAVEGAAPTGWEKVTDLKSALGALLWTLAAAWITGRNDSSSLRDPDQGTGPVKNQLGHFSALQSRDVWTTLTIAISSLPAVWAIA